MKHLKIAITRTKSLPWALAATCVFALSAKTAFPEMTGLGDTLLLLFILMAILDLIYAYMRDIVKD